ncbi:UDP-N-acetylglucosamine transporter [Stylophora pistillata]|uniref:UDP-N-acetylglucosamine transporter n=1 Tax=Stylophora pistillata TaxID=50429 RepID=A0A2B4RQS2_STYPI|nr:UDP-N-acetylglucosamine transporter [Stylophora pistillata]
MLYKQPLSNLAFRTWFFEGSNIPLSTWLHLMFLWAIKASGSNIARLTSLSKPTVIRALSDLRTALCSSSLNLSSVDMSSRPVPSTTTLSVNCKSNRKWEPTVIEQGFALRDENISSSVQMPGKHAHEKGIGVTMVQIDTHTSVETEMSTSNSVKKQQSTFLGFVSVLAASMVSGFAGVYMEKIFKTGKRKLFWISNAQLYTFGIFLSLLGVAYQDGVQIARLGFFHGYDIIVCLVILFASAGGIIVSLILKYASCITKGFATSCAIVLSSLVSVYVFYFIPSVLFVLGAVSVIISVLLYSC